MIYLFLEKHKKKKKDMHNHLRIFLVKLKPCLDWKPLKIMRLFLEL